MPARESSQRAPHAETVITRIFDAPRELVFRTWTNPGHVAEWWGPKGSTYPVCELDLRPGGAIRIDIHLPGGAIFHMRGAFREVIEPERLAAVVVFSDEQGKVQLELSNTVTFEEPAARRKSVSAQLCSTPATKGRH